MAFCEAFYWTSAWRKLRQFVIESEPLCRACKTHLAKDVDHIIPLEVRPDLGLVLSNLQPLCRTCHNAKTRQGNQQAA